MATRIIPAPGEAPMPAADAAELLRRNGTGEATRHAPAVRTHERVWTHAELLAESNHWANLFIDRTTTTRDGGRHVGVLLDNIPEYLFALSGAALSGATVVGLNHTRRGEHLLRDITHTDVSLIITERRHIPLLDGVGSALPEVLVVEDGLGNALEKAGGEDRGKEPGPEARLALVFTSGTSAAPKAVICTQRRILTTGARMTMIMDLGADDVGYLCMPLFHSNSLMVGWAPSIVAAASVGLAPRFSASGWLPDVRAFGSTWFNYTGKPLAYIVATPEKSDDADNPLRVAFGNEGSPEVVAEFGRRFGVEVIDVFGATEGGVALEHGIDLPPGAVGRAPANVVVVDDVGEERSRAVFDHQGVLLNADDCVGEIVNTAGAGPFEGYYNNADATAATLRKGWYWSGDLGYMDEARNMWFAGRTGDWIRVDGENFPAGPIDSALSRHPDVVVAAAYGVPDAQAGDQVMAALVLREGAALDPAAFASWVDEVTDVGPKWRPMYLRVARELPTTGTNKILKRTLVKQKFRRDLCDDDDLWVRDKGAASYRPFTAVDEDELRAVLERAGRGRFWDL